MFFNACLHSRSFPLHANWRKSDSSVYGEAQGNCKWNSNSRYIVASSPSFSRPAARAPRKTCSQALVTQASNLIPMRVISSESELDRWFVTPTPTGIKAVTVNLIGCFEELRRMILKTGCYVYNKQYIIFGELGFHIFFWKVAIKQSLTKLRLNNLCEYPTTQSMLLEEEVLLEFSSYFA